MAGKIPATSNFLKSRIGIKLFVGSASPRGIRKTQEMGGIDSVFPYSTLTAKGKIDFIAYSCNDRRPKGGRIFLGERIRRKIG